jgi:hypothetical protein
VFESQCKTSHEKLLAGKCPWCGQVVINGRTVPTESTFEAYLRLRRVLLVGRAIIMTTFAIVATGIALASSCSLVTASGIGLGVSITAMITMLGIFRWHAAWTIGRANMKRRNHGDHRAGDRSTS